jgi:hypothetical protein
MEAVSPSFWAGREWVAQSVVNGLLGSTFLWIFWVPFITFLALPIASAMTKQDICRAVSRIPSTGTSLPTYSQYPAGVLVQSDWTTIREMNVPNILSLWFLGALCVTLNLWLVQTIIRSAGLNWGPIMRLNIVMFAVIVIMELAFFMGVGMHYIPFNMRDMYNDLIRNTTDELRQMIPA